MQQRPGAFEARWAGGRRRRGALVVGAVLVVVGVPALGFVASSHALDVLAVAGVVLLVGVVVIDIRFVPVLSIPSTWLILRAGGASGLSGSDLVLFIATLCALTVFSLREAPEVRRLLYVLAVYQATTLLAVIDNPYRSDIVEWIHEAFLVGGSLVVGWVVGRSARARPAVTSYVLVASGFAAWACVQTVTHHLQAANLPGGIQKNYVGDMLSFAVIIIYARPPWLGWKGRIWTRRALVLCLLGILSAQSKQAIISLVVGVLLIYFRNRGMGRRSKAIFLALLPMAIVAYVIVSGEVKSHNRFNSVYTRLSVFSTNFKVWDHSRLVGVGLRWWYLPKFLGSIQPPNAEMEMLTSAGLIGLAGFAVLVFGSFSILRKVPRHLGTLALAILLMRLVQGQLDIFWVAAQGSLPWMIIGVILGVAALERSHHRGLVAASSARHSRQPTVSHRSRDDVFADTDTEMETEQDTTPAQPDQYDVEELTGPARVIPLAYLGRVGSVIHDPTIGVPRPEPLSGNASSRQLVRNFATGYAGLLVSLLLSLFLTPIVLRHLGATDYGLWIVITTVGAYVGLLGAGVGTAAIQSVAAATARGDGDKVAEILATAQRFFLVTGTLAVAITVLVIPFVGRILGLHGAALGTARWGLVAMGVFSAVGLLTGVPSSALQGTGRNDIVGLVALVASIATQGAQIVLVLLGKGVVDLVVATTIGASASFIALDVVARRMQLLVPGRGRPTRAMLRELIRSGGRNVTVSIGGTITYGLDAFLIGAILPLGQVAPYDLALSAVTLTRSFSTAGTDLLLPTFAHSSALDDHERQFRLFTRAMLSSMVLNASMSIALVGFGRPILALWLGSVPTHTYEILVVFTIVFFLQLPGHQAFVFLTGIGKNKLLAQIALPLAIVNLALSVGATFWLGPVGPAIANIPQMAILDFSVLPLICCRLMARPYRDYARAVLLPLTVPVVTAVVTTALCSWLLGDSSKFLAPFEAVAVVLVALAAFLAFLVRFDPSVRMTMQRFSRPLKALRG